MYKYIEKNISLTNSYVHSNLVGTRLREIILLGPIILIG